MLFAKWPPSLHTDKIQALVDGPSKNPDLAVDRHATALGNVVLTHIVIEKLPRAAGRGAVAKAWEKSEVEQKWDQSAWAKRRALREKRRGLSDFERFKVLRLTKQVCSLPNRFSRSGALAQVYQA